jgi:hypothetical protein
VVLSSTAFTELCETLADSEEIGFDFAVHFVYCALPLCHLLST